MADTTPKPAVRTVRKASAIPVYFAAGGWLAAALALPMYRASDYLIAAGIAAGTFWIGRLLFPGRLVEEALPYQPPASADAAADALIQEGAGYLVRIRQANDRIQDPALSAKIDRLEAATDRIFRHLAENPGRLPSVRRFMNYYLPTTLKLLEAYGKMATEPVRGENMQSVLAGVEDVMDTIVAAFEKQLDVLYDDLALDITTDITVLEGMLSSQGLIDPAANDTKK